MLKRETGAIGAKRSKRDRGGERQRSKRENELRETKIHVQESQIS